MLAQGINLSSQFDRSLRDSGHAIWIDATNVESALECFLLSNFSSVLSRYYRVFYHYLWAIT
jgi:hypothetical protein